MSNFVIVVAEATTNYDECTLGQYNLYADEHNLMAVLKKLTDLDEQQHLAISDWGATCNVGSILTVPVEDAYTEATIVCLGVAKPKPYRVETVTEKVVREIEVEVQKIVEVESKKPKPQTKDKKNFKKKTIIGRRQE